MKHQKWQWKIWATLKKYKFNSIFVRNFLVTMFMMTLPLLCIVTIIQSYVNVIVEKEILETNRKSLERTAETINSVVDQVFSFSYYLARSEELVLLGLMSYEELQEEYLNYIEKNVHAYVKIQEYIDSVYIYMERQGCVISYSRSEMVAGKVELLSDKEDSAWLEEYLNMGNRVYTIKSRQKKGHYPYLLSVITSIQNCEKGAKGAIVVNINMKELGKVLGHQINDEQMFFMLDHNGNICYTNQVAFIDNDTKEYVYSDFLWGAEGVYEIDGKQYLMSYVKEEDGEWNYVLCNLMTAYLERMDQVNFLTFVLLLVSCVIGILVSYVVAAHSYDPIRYILEEVEGIEDSDSMKELELNGTYIDDVNGQIYRNELQYISNMVRNTRIRNNRLQIEAGEWMKKLNTLQMRALQSQINPHYLYNTLDAINWSAIEQLGEDNNVSDMLTSLAQFFRISLQRSSYMISIEEEIEHVKLYGKILKSRHGEMIQIHWNIDQKIIQYKVIRLCLQPLLENAVNHGLRWNRYVGNIWISGSIMENYVILSVADDGKGMDVDSCRRLNSQLLTDYESDSEHVGIRNVNQRMKILFGDEYGVNVMNRENGGLAVRLIFPKI